MTPRRVAIVPHTHWDREWYEPFQTFRMKLVDALDRLLDLMESDPSYTDFLVDGQMAAVDDYLAVRPEAEHRIRDLAVAGRLTMGPWYILMDEFLVSGETIVRDLQMGLERGAAFGGAMEVGYLPDMFGHIAQMPQILRLAGMEHAVVWRGVPSEITRTGFFWEALDGSTVRAEYLPFGYGNGAELPSDGKSLVRRIEDHEQEVGSFLIDRLLLMNGSDHLPPQPALGRAVAEANALDAGYELEITSLPAYLAEAPTEGLERWKGELRSGARANVLMGVTSNRVDVKHAAAETEFHLERRAEPYGALFLPAGEWPERLLSMAWREVVRDAAHDSICACSVDDVVDAVLHRFAEARQIAEGVASRALSALAHSMAEPGAVVVNPSARTRSGMVELVVGADVPPGDDVQVLSERFGLPGSMTLDAGTVRTVLSMLQGPKIDNDAWVQDIRIEEDETGIDLTVAVGPEERPGVPIAEAKQDLYTRLGARPDVSVRVHLDQPPIRRIAARVDSVPGLGWRTFAPQPLSHPAHARTAPAGGEGTSGAGTEGVELTNGMVTVVVDGDDGTFSIDGLGGFGRLVDGGDLGDSYNYSPPSRDALVHAPRSVRVEAIESGPVRATAVITATYCWPDHVDGASQSRVGENEVEVTTTLEVRADEKTVRVATSFVNPSRDHRLRVHLPLPRPASVSEAGCAFASVTRGLTIEGRPDERGLPTFPSHRFVQAGGLTVLHDGVVEYELVDINGSGDGSPDENRASTLALTVLRSTGMLSRLGMAYRPFPAGPLTPVEGLQLCGRRITARYALAMGVEDPWVLADEVLAPLEVVTAPGGGWRAERGSALHVEGAQVSAVLRRAGLLEVRVFNPTPHRVAVRIEGRHGWLIDLRGAPQEPFDESFELRPFGIATVRLLDDRS
ncbi:MAG: alpha-mannosidase [Actinomycetota bacterium]|nr:alpha-mannosidase [Actinomycetota bacterium]